MYYTVLQMHYKTFTAKVERVVVSSEAAHHSPPLFLPVFLRCGASLSVFQEGPHCVPPFPPPLPTLCPD